MSKEKLKGSNYMPNNRIRVAVPTIRKNIIRVENFNENVLRRSNNADKATQIHLEVAGQYNNDCHRKQNQNILKNSIKLINLQNLQHQPQCLAKHSQESPHFTKSREQETFHPIFLNTSQPIKINQKHKHLSHITILPRKLTKNHYHPFHLREFERETKLLQLYAAALPSVLHDLKHQHNESQTPSKSLKGKPSTKEVLCGMFEVLPPSGYFQLSTKLSAAEIIKPGLESRHHQQYRDILQDIKRKCLLLEPESKNLRGTRTLIQNRNSFDYGRVMKYLQKKTKPSDCDVVFGNAYYLLSKRYGWENSRINWLLKLEQEN